MSTNPYQAPLCEETLESYPDTHDEFVRRQLLGVARTFEFLGFGILLVVGVFFAAALSVRGVAMPIGTLEVGMMVVGAGVSIWLLLVARRIAQHDASVRLQALFLCGVMLLGFPILTIFGGACFLRVKNYLVPTNSTTRSRI